MSSIKDRNGMDLTEAEEKVGRIHRRLKAGEEGDDRG